MTQLPKPTLLFVAGSRANDRTLTSELEAWTTGHGLRLETLHTPSNSELKSHLEQKRVGVAVLDARNASSGLVCNFLRLVREQNRRTPVMVLRDRSPLPQALRREQRHKGLLTFVSGLTDLGSALADAWSLAAHSRPERDASPGPEPASGRALELLRENQKLIEVGRLASSIAHEINNPLESITNLLFLAKSEPGLPQDALHYLEMAEREMGRVVTISKQTLNFSRETSQPVHVPLNELLDEVLVLYRQRIHEKRIRIKRRYSASRPAYIFPGEMRQVFSNLITNAIEAMGPDGTLSLRIRMACSPGSRSEQGIRVTIADNGPGIPPEVRHRLGEPFFTTKGQQGTGLGLWVSRSIIHRCGGTLRLRSAYGGEHHGTVFSLYLPLRAQGQPSATIHTLPSAVKAGGHGASAGDRSSDRSARNKAIPFRKVSNGS